MERLWVFDKWINKAKTKSYHIDENRYDKLLRLENTFDGRELSLLLWSELLKDEIEVKEKWEEFKKIG